MLPMETVAFSLDQTLSPWDECQVKRKCQKVYSDCMNIVSPCWPYSAEEQVFVADLEPALMYL